MAGLKLLSLNRSFFLCLVKQYSPVTRTWHLQPVSHLLSRSLRIALADLEQKQKKRIPKYFSTSKWFFQYAIYSFSQFHQVFLMLSLLWFLFHASYLYEKYFLNPFLVLFSDKLLHCRSSAETQMRKINFLYLVLFHSDSVSSQDSQLLLTVAMGSDSIFYVVLCVSLQHMAQKCYTWSENIVSRVHGLI